MQKITHKKDTFALLYLTVLSAVALVYGFTIIPSPTTIQKIIADHKRIIDLGSIQTTVDDYYSNNGVLPQSLNDLNYNANDATTPLQKNDPQTKQQYEYTQTSPTDYRLCATFSTDSSNDDLGAYDDANNDYASFISQFSHPAGHYCFDEYDDPSSINNNSNNGNATDITTPTPMCEGNNCPVYPSDGSPTPVPMPGNSAGGGM